MQTNQRFSLQKSSKIEVRGVPEALGGGLGTILAPRGAPGVSQGRSDPKKLPKVRSNPVRSPPRGLPKMVDFRYFSDFRVVFLKMFFGCVF